jgi:predicted ATPase
VASHTRLAKTQGKIGQAEEGLHLLDEAIAIMFKTGQRNYEAELYRLKGQLTLQKLPFIRSQLSVTDPRPPTPDLQGEAETCFLKVINIAHKQQAKSWELRATMSLARLWQQQGRKKEVHEVLAAVYNWFTEGFDTADLKEAKVLLEELT